MATGSPRLPRWLVLRTLRLPQRLNPLLPTQQPGRLSRPRGTAGGNGQRDAGSRGVVGCLEDDQHVVVAEGVTTHQNLGAHGLKCWRDRLYAILWFLDLGRYRLGGVGGLVQIQRHGKTLLTCDGSGIL